jgi:hypothetical protein
VRVRAPRRVAAGAVQRGSRVPRGAGRAPPARVRRRRMKIDTDVRCANARAAADARRVSSQHGRARRPRRRHAARNHTPHQARPRGRRCLARSSSPRAGC